MTNALINALEKRKTFLKFAVVGFSGVFVNLGCFTLLLHSGINKFLSSPIAIELSIVSNFLLNNFWTFAHRDSPDKFHSKGVKFNIVSLIALGVSYSTFVLLCLIIPDVMPQIHQAIGILPGTIVNYTLNSRWTFRRRSD